MNLDSVAARNVGTEIYGVSFCSALFTDFHSIRCYAFKIHMDTACKESKFREDGKQHTFR